MGMDLTHVGPYLLERRLAAGGMAELWLAHAPGQPVHAEPVVVKRIHPWLARQPGFRAMFYDEARTVRGFDHPNLVRVLDCGAHEGTDYIVMEYLRGRDLRQVLSRCLSAGVAVPPAWALSAVRGAALGLAHAHAQRDAAGAPRRIVHRDVSPENLFLTFKGATKVLDFGVAAGASRTHQTESGVLKGKCEYMSPEQVDGEAVDHRSDQFSLGVVLYELLAGASLFGGRNTGETLRAVVRCKVQGFPFAASRELETALRRSLSRDRAHRFASCADFAAALVLAPELDLRPGAAERLGAWLSGLFPEGEVAAAEPAPRGRTTRKERRASA